MEIIEGKIRGLLIIKPDIYEDNRGLFLETWNEKEYYYKLGEIDFVQDNLSQSKKGVLRGLHFQDPSWQDKLISVIKGEVFDVAVDIRVGSKTFGQWEGIILNEVEKKQFFIPKGFAHGFEVLSDYAIFSYKCSNFYFSEESYTLMWNDPDIGIKWYTKEPLLSDKDKEGILLRDLNFG